MIWNACLRSGRHIWVLQELLSADGMRAVTKHCSKLCELYRDDCRTIHTLIQRKAVMFVKSEFFYASFNPPLNSSPPCEK